jgi:hypothetical protein
MRMSEKAAGTPADGARDFHLERYKHILHQLTAANENVYRFLSIYQALATGLVGGAVILFVSYRRWNISVDVARAGIIGLLVLVTLVAAFTTLLIFIGIRVWLDYRREECDLLDEAVRPGFRERPRVRNFYRWYETYVLVFILFTVLAMWLVALIVLLPAIR